MAERHYLRNISRKRVQRDNQGHVENGAPRAHYQCSVYGLFTFYDKQNGCEYASN